LYWSFPLVSIPCKNLCWKQKLAADLFLLDSQVQWFGSSFLEGLSSIKLDLVGSENFPNFFRNFRKLTHETSQLFPLCWAAKITCQATSLKILLLYSTIWCNKLVRFPTLKTFTRVSYLLDQESRARKSALLR